MHRPTTIRVGSTSPGVAAADTTLTLGLFSRVNNSSTAKEIFGSKMYSEWASVQPIIEEELISADLSVLSKFPMMAGKGVATPIVRHLASNLGISSNSQCEPSLLEDDKDVLWCMEVVSYGLGLPLTEHDTIRDSVNVYCEWLMALLKPKICVPKPIETDPNRYAQIMLKHFYNVFVPRSDANADSVNRQVVLCHRVLRTLQKVARESRSLVRETWESMLMLLLAISDVLLAPPTVADDIGDQLCERVVGVLFEIWLLSCTHCFPSPSLWRTFRDICLNWRHRINLVEQWTRVNMALTSKLLKIMYGTSFPELKIGEDDNHFSSVEMTKECVTQSWFRFLHLLGNPVELCYPAVVSNTPKFLHFAITSECVVDPCQHECLGVLPHVFFRAMYGVSVLVDAFLGVANYAVDELTGKTTLAGSSAGQHPSVTPPQLRKPSKSFSVTSAAAKSSAPQKPLLKNSHQVAAVGSQPNLVFSSSSTAECRPALASARPRCNSMLHLFGSWLFEAAFVGSHLSGRSTADKTSQTSLVLDSRRGSAAQPPPPSSLDDIPIELSVEHYESGRAEAIGSLCRIFCSKKTGEEILPVYLARFYLAVQHGLKAGNGQVICSVVMNCRDLFKLDLDGVMVLLPDLVDALELILPERELKFRASFQFSLAELRRASIHLLLSMLPLPLHFRSLPIKELMSSSADRAQLLRFGDWRPRLVNLLVAALQSETDSLNMQLLLGGLLFSIQDVAFCEAEAASPQQQTDDDDDGGGADNCTSSDYAASFDSSTQAASESDSFDPPPPPLDSTYALFVRATYLVCQRLGSSWKTDLNVSLAALELLSGFAKIKIPDNKETLECKLPVKWVCDYIVNQCNRPPQFHSKDLHSNIVAAFRCICVWLMEHSYLLHDPDCLGVVLGVVELGISGSKSHSKLGALDMRCLKTDKECKPASMRVRDAAESVLCYVMEHVGSFPSPSGAASLSSLLDEQSLLAYCNGGGDAVSKTQAARHFRYYVVDGSIILALLEQPLGNDQDPQPTITVLVRGCFGRNAWTMQLRHLPRHRSGNRLHPSNPGRPLPTTDHHVRHHVRQRYFPETVNAIQPCKAERSIPTLETLIVGKVAKEHERLTSLVEQQMAFEESVRKNISSQKPEYPNPETECRAPEVRHEFETSRLFLNHFGFLSLESVKHSLDSPTSRLISLNASGGCQPGFAHDLEALDSVSARTCDTAFVFYVKSGQKTVLAILDNVKNGKEVHPHFVEFLLSLGRPVDVHTHPGWTGHVSTSFRVTTVGAETAKETSSKASIGFSGRKQVLYWSDALAEVAFVVPSPKRRSEEEGVPPLLEAFKGSPPMLSPHHFGSETNVVRSPETAREKPRTLSLDTEKTFILKDRESPSDSRGRKIGRQCSSTAGYDTKVLVIWLERFEDYLIVPIDCLSLETNTGLEVGQRAHEKDAASVIFVHPLRSGLFRIRLQAQLGKTSMAIPLVDGMVVSRRVLGCLVRQTVLNICLRKRLENDGYYPPHLRRKIKIQDMVHKYGQRASEPEFYTMLFENLASA